MTGAEDRGKWAAGPIPAWLLAALLVAAGLAVYWNSLPAPFQFDDRYFIADDDSLERLWPPGGRIATRPVLNFTLAFNRALGDLDPRGYRAGNIAIHLAAGLLLFGIVRRTLRGARLRSRFAARADGLAFAVALLWVVHPLSTMAVTYLWQRGESLMALFFLGVVYSVVRWEEEGRWRWRVLALLAFFAGCGTKETMVAVFPVALLLDGVLLSPSVGAAWQRRRLLYGTMAASCLLGALVVLPRMGTSHAALGPLRYAASQPGIVLDYLRLALWPDPLCFDYQRSAAYGFAAVGVPVAILGVAGLATGWALKRGAWTGIGGAWILLTLAPSSSFVPINDLMVEYRMYLPLAGAAALAVGAGRVLCGWTRLPGPVLLALAATALGWTTVRRNRDYLSAEALWASTVAVAPDNMRGHYELGVARFHAGRGGGARASFERATELIERIGAERALGGPPSGVNCETVELRDLSGAFLELGLRDAPLGERLADLDRALELWPEDPRAHGFRGACLRESGRVDEALAAFERAIALDPAAPYTREGRGLCLLDLGRAAEALEAFHRALTLAPSRGSAVLGRALCYRALGRDAEARVDLRRLLEQADDAGLRERAEALLAR